MSDQMYREIILERYREPQFRGGLEDADISVSEANPLCGDSLQFELKFGRDGRVEAVAWDGEGCAISQASADLLSEKLVGMAVDEVAQITKDDVLAYLGIDLGPSRLKCALLGISTVHKGLRQSGRWSGLANNETG